MQRVTAYVDGFNLYFGLKNSGFKRYYWLDVVKLTKTLLKPDQTLSAAHYFTARIHSNGRNSADQKRQNGYLEALALQGAKSQFGQYLQKNRSCRSCGSTWPDYEEKMTDVNIAIQLLSDAVDDAFEVALIVSADSDLTPPIRWVKKRYPCKRLIVIFPPGRSSSELKNSAHGYLTIGEDKLRASQLPDEIVKHNGYTLSRPASWR